MQTLLDQAVAHIISQENFDQANFDVAAVVANLGPDVVEAMLVDLLAEEERVKFNKFKTYFPDTGRFRRELYPKHLEFFAAGKEYLERLFRAANRVGKSVAGAYEVTAHLTGQYPHWWEGWTVPRSIAAWAAGDTNETTRDIIQKELLGEVTWNEAGKKTLNGSGMIPRDCIGRITWKSGVQDMVDTALIKHTSGRWSQLGLKSFDQGRRVFQGTAKDVIWLDEECPEDVYGECLTRLATTNGRLLTTFTPLNGRTAVVKSFDAKPQNQ